MIEEPRFITVAQLTTVLRYLPDTYRIEVNEVRNLLITDSGDQPLGYIDMATGKLESFTGDAHDDLVDATVFAWNPTSRPE